MNRRELSARLYRTIRPAFGLRGIEREAAMLKRGDTGQISEAAVAAILRTAAQIPYYAPLIKKTGQTLEALPVLTKPIIRRHFAQLQNPHPTGRRYTNSSGGSTGSPLQCVQDKTYASWSEVTLEYYYRTFHGIDYLAVPKVVLWGSERDTFKERDLVGKLYNALTNTHFLNSFRVEAADWARYAETINQVKPYFIRGYAGSLYALARAVRMQNLTIHRPHFLYSSAEVLRDFMRKEIEEVFQAKVYDFYGSREVGPIAGECRAGHLHIFTFNTHVEVGEGEQLLVSTLHNHSMPLLRYAIGDTGRLGEGPCSCGSPLPWLAELTGRITDHFRTKDGTLVHGEYFTHLFYHQEWAAEFQVNQLDFQAVEILIVPRTEEVPAAAKSAIEEKIRHVLGRDCQVTWKLVSRIEKTAQGKLLFTRCLLP